jgi:hypothetical protein
MPSRRSLFSHIYQELGSKSAPGATAGGSLAANGFERPEEETKEVIPFRRLHKHHRYTGDAPQDRNSREALADANPFQEKIAGYFEQASASSRGVAAPRRMPPPDTPISPQPRLSTKTNTMFGLICCVWAIDRSVRAASSVESFDVGRQRPGPGGGDSL